MEELQRNTIRIRPHHREFGMQNLKNNVKRVMVVKRWVSGSKFEVQGLRLVYCVKPVRFPPDGVAVQPCRFWWGKSIIMIIGGRWQMDYQGIPSEKTPVIGRRSVAIRQKLRLPWIANRLSQHSFAAGQSFDASQWGIQWMDRMMNK